MLENLKNKIFKQSFDGKYKENFPHLSDKEKNIINFKDLFSEYSNEINELQDKKINNVEKSPISIKRNKTNNSYDFRGMSLQDIYEHYHLEINDLFTDSSPFLKDDVHLWTIFSLNREEEISELIKPDFVSGTSILLYIICFIFILVSISESSAIMALIAASFYWLGKFLKDNVSYEYSTDGFIKSNSFTISYQKTTLANIIYYLIKYYDKYDTPEHNLKLKIKIFKHIHLLNEQEKKDIPQYYSTYMLLTDYVRSIGNDAYKTNHIFNIIKFVLTIITNVYEDLET